MTDSRKSPHAALSGLLVRSSGCWTCVWSLRRTVLVPAKKVGPRARGRWDELVGGIVKERKRLCWYWCSRLPDLLLSECGCGGCNERQDDHEPVERESVHCLVPRCSNRTFEPSHLFLGSARRRRAGSLADNTEVDVES